MVTICPSSSNTKRTDHHERPFNRYKAASTELIHFITSTLKSCRIAAQTYDGSYLYRANRPTENALKREKSPDAEGGSTERKHGGRRERGWCWMAPYLVPEVINHFPVILPLGVFLQHNTDDRRPASITWSHRLQGTRFLTVSSHADIYACANWTRVFFSCGISLRSVCHRCFLIYESSEARV